MEAKDPQETQPSRSWRLATASHAPLSVSVTITTFAGMTDAVTGKKIGAPGAGVTLSDLPLARPIGWASPAHVCVTGP